MSILNNKHSKKNAKSISSKSLALTNDTNDGDASYSHHNLLPLPISPNSVHMNYSIVNTSDFLYLKGLLGQQTVFVYISDDKIYLRNALEVSNASINVEVSQQSNGLYANKEATMGFALRLNDDGTADMSFNGFIGAIQAYNSSDEVQDIVFLKKYIVNKGFIVNELAHGEYEVLPLPTEVGLPHLNGEMNPTYIPRISNTATMTINSANELTLIDYNVHDTTKIDATNTYKLS